MKAVFALFVIGAVSACTCVTRPFCVLTMDAVNLLRAKATASHLTDSHKIYTLTVSKVFKGSVISELKTPTSSGLCGLSLKIGVDYLIATDADGNANMCGPSRVWSSLSPAERRIVNRGGDCDDCSKVKCSKFQHCKIFDQDNSPYCADFCAPGRCKPDETCTLKEVQCIRAPCPPIATCEKCIKDCTLEFNPVCGSDGLTYGNQCVLNNAICADSTLKKAHDGQCKQPDCDTFLCPQIFAPVCGSDGKTYSNQCFLGIGICKDPSLTKAHDGACGDSNQ